MDTKFVHLSLFLLQLIIVREAASQPRDDNAHPGVRNGHSMVYHSALKGVFIFGGADEKQVIGDTWLWSKKRWQKLNDKGPNPRTFGAMVYREKTNEVVLFGGNKVLFGGEDKTDVLLNDTWIWREGNWTQIKTQESPEPRSEAAMAYDAKQDIIILFGGFKFSDDAKSLIRLRDTWKFDGRAWTKVDSTGPSARSGSTMVFDPNVEKIILFGGNFPRKPEEKLTYNGSTWCYSNNRWDSVPTKVPNVYNSSMAYDKTSDRIIRFGGWSGSERLNETWMFKDLAWHKIVLNDYPEPRNHAVIVYDAGESRMTLFGGHNGDEVFGDLWILDKRGWKKIVDYPKRKRLENDH